MLSNAEPLQQKKLFLRENEFFTELELNEESKPIGRLQDIDLSENEIWLLQCPKGMNVAEFENEKLKIPGRTNIKDCEAVCMEFNTGKEQHAFAYYNRKRRYSLRLLPVRGTIIVRDHLKAAKTVTSEWVKECCPPDKRVPLPSTIRVRHPLLGSQYTDKLTLDNSVKKRLQKADDVSTQILRESLSQNLGSYSKTATKKCKVTNSTINSLAIEIKSDDENNVKIIDEETLKKNKSKRKHREDLAEKNTNEEVIKKKKSNKSNKFNETVAEDLQWLHNI